MSESLGFAIADTHRFKELNNFIECFQGMASVALWLSL